MSDTTQTYKATRNYCGCHPETCCCSPWAIYDPNGKRVAGFQERSKAEEIAALLNKAMQAPTTRTEPAWISVKDRLPDLRSTSLVITYTKSGTVGTHHVSTLLSLVREEIAGIDECYITHWMPLPAGPGAASGQEMTVIQGPCREPKEESLYCIFRTDHKGYSVGIVIAGGDANWHSTEILAHAELPITTDQLNVALKSQPEAGSRK